MIIVHGSIPIRPERRERALELARQMTEATRTEVGCISYEFFVGLSDPNTLMLFQEWDSMEALMGHYQTEHMEEFLRELPEVVTGEISTRRYLVQSVEEDAEETAAPPPVIH
ncbi:MAG: putative quinol monooxygenase [Pseudomonadales bacterium]